MRLAQLVLRSFRNLVDDALEFPPEGVAVVGPNAQGKSNLLEAIYYLEVLRSFRGAPDRDLVRFGGDVFRLQGRVVTAENDAPFQGGRPERTVAAAWQRSGGRKKVTLDDVETERLGDGVGHVCAVLFTPADLALVDDGPHVRRRYLDIVLSLSEPGYMAALQRYRQGLSQRNAALKAGGHSPQTHAWEPLLVDAGSRVTVFRSRWIDTMAASFSRIHEEISGGTGARMTLDSGIPGLPEGQLELEGVSEALEVALREARDRDVRLGTTTVGPHRDELLLLLAPGEGAQDVRRFGSGGQRRSVALGLRLLEAETIRRRRGREPLLLMDDVFAELDEARSMRLLDLLHRTAVGQVILTAPRKAEIRFRQEGIERWGIRDGRILR